MAQSPGRRPLQVRRTRGPGAAGRAGAPTTPSTAGALDAVAMVGRAQNRVALACDLRPSPAYPFALRLTVEYRLGRDGLTVVADADNLGRPTCHSASAFTPISPSGTSTVDHVRLTVPAEHGWSPTTVACPPGGRPVAGTEFDFTSRQARSVSPSSTPPSPASSGLGRPGLGRSSTTPDGPAG